MTIGALLLGWLALAVLVTPRVSRRLAKVRPSLQAGGLLGATVALATIPAAVAVTVLYQALVAAEVSGSILSRCGRLIAAVVGDPLAHLDVTLALVVLALGTIGLAVGTRSAWRSQSRCHKLIGSGPERIVVLPVRDQMAFTTGFVRPRIVASAGLLEAAPSQWREVVLAHEEAHRRFRHPLMLFVAESLARGIPLHPVRWAADASRVALEMVADEFASRQTGSRELVADVVAGVALAPIEAAVGFEGATVQRVRNLLAGPVKGRTALGVALVAGVLLVLSLGTAHAAHCANASVGTLTAERCRVHLGARSDM